MQKTREYNPNLMSERVEQVPQKCPGELMPSLRPGAVLRWGGTGPPNVGQAPQIFWFQQQKYAFLKSRLFLYSGEINTRIS